MQENQQGNVEKKPSKINRPGQGGNPYVNPARPAKEDEASFDSENNSGEINPGKLDREEINPDRSGADGSKGHEPYEFKNRPGGDRSIRKGYDESNFAVDSRAERHGEGTTFKGDSSSVKKSQQGILIGQTHAGSNGYDTSDTSGISSEENRKSGPGSIGSRNGSTGFNAGSSEEDHRIHPERPNKEVDINKLGKKSEGPEKKRDPPLASLSHFIGT